jgi:hypothetical protein
MIDLLALMLFGHAICDYPLQGDWLAKAKNHVHPIMPGETVWPTALACHAGIHAGAVLIVTGSWLIASLEFVAHAGIDHVKCAGRLSFNQDQALHVICKGLWAVLLTSGLTGA